MMSMTSFACLSNAMTCSPDPPRQIAREVGISEASSRPLPEPSRQAERVERGADLGIVVEIDIDVAPLVGRSRGGAATVLRRAAGRPEGDSRRPAIERRVVIAADIELPGAVQGQIEEIAGDVLEIGPRDGVGEDEGDVVAPQQRDEARRHEALVADLDGMAQPTLVGSADPRTAGDALVMPPREATGFVRITRQKREERLEPRLVE